MSEEIKEITYKKLSQIERFVGPDIEDAPDDCSPGSTFFEAQEGSDVGRLYVFDGTRWAEKQQRVTGITLEGENINIVDPETLGKEATLQILKAELAAIKSAQTDGSQKVQLSGTNASVTIDGTDYEVAYEIGPDGKAYPKTVDGAPYAYDPATGSLKTISVGVTKAVKNVSSTSNIIVAPPNGSQTIEIVPPSNKLWKVLYFGFRALKIDSATTGTHQFIVRYGKNESFFNLLRGETAYNKELNYEGWAFTTTDTQIPATADLQKRAFDNLYISEDVPLYVVYQNRTDANTNGIRRLHLLVLEEGVS